LIVLDAYALIALLADEPAAEEVELLLRTGETAMTLVNFAEAIDASRRLHKVPPDELRALLEPLLGEPVELLAQSETDAWRAAEIRARYYDRRRCAVSLADCFLLAAAGPDDRIATADPAVAAVAREEQVDLVALPDSRGTLP
jgi:predicted nucleic acid-binding protein